LSSAWQAKVHRNSKQQVKRWNRLRNLSCVQPSLHLYPAP